MEHATDFARTLRTAGYNARVIRQRAHPKTCAASLQPGPLAAIGPNDEFAVFKRGDTINCKYSKADWVVVWSLQSRDTQGLTKKQKTTQAGKIATEWDWLGVAANSFGFSIASSGVNRSH